MEENVKFYTYGLDPEDIIGITSSVYLNPKIKKGRDPISYANSIMDGFLFSNPLLEDNPQYEIGNINWDIQYSSSPSSYNLGLQALDMVSILSYGYLETRQLKYLERAYAILLNWISYLEENQKPNNKYVWYDHSVASRLLNIVYFLSIRNTNKRVSEFFLLVDEEKLIRLLEIHAEYLMNHNNYAYKSNHGIMSDRALITLALFIPDNMHSNEWLNRGIERMTIQYYQLLLSNGVYLENSPTYSLVVLNWLEEIECLLRKYGHSLNILDFYSRINNAYQFLVNATMPNRFLPMWGDTPNSKINNDSIYLNRPPLDGMSVYQDGGYAFIGDRENNLWMGLKSGYIEGNAHKHDDDLSFVLYVKGLDVFLDSGLYNYEPSDPFRQYIISAKAHNLIIVDDQSFSPSLINDKRAGIIDWQDNRIFYYVKAFNTLYPGVSIERRIYYIKPGIILLFDEIQSLEEHTYSQLFQLNEHITVNQIDQNSIELTWEDNHQKISVRQLAKDLVLNIHKGNKKFPRYGLISRDLTKLIETQTLEYSIYERNTFFLTLIDTTNQFTACVSKISEEILNIEINNSKGIGLVSIPIEIKTRSIDSYTDYSADVEIGNLLLRIDKKQINENSFSYILNVSSQETDQYLYTWYIHKNGAIIEKRNWSVDNTLQLSNLEAGIFEIQSYIRNKQTDNRFTRIIDKLYIA